MIEFIKGDPCPAVKFLTVEAETTFVIAQVATVEQEEQLVPLPLVRCPVDGDELPGKPIET